jgi:hypothetical protein
LTPHDAATLRLRAENGQGLCLHEHTMHQSPGGAEVWVTCDTPEGPVELGRLRVVQVGDTAERVERFTLGTLGAHERAAAANHVLNLLDECERLERLASPRLIVPGRFG